MPTGALTGSLQILVCPELLLMQWSECYSTKLIYCKFLHLYRCVAYFIFYILCTLRMQMPCKMTKELKEAPKSHRLNQFGPVSLVNTQSWKHSFRTVSSKQFECIEIPAGELTIYYLVEAASENLNQCSQCLHKHFVKFKYYLSKADPQTLPIETRQTATVNHALFLFAPSGNRSEREEKLKTKNASYFTSQCYDFQ